jgi:hypothetical protein
MYRYVLIGLAVVLAIPLTVYAAHFTIDTDDGLVDSNWASVNLLNTDGGDLPIGSYDIDQTWVTNTADNSFFYFRANLIGSAQLPSYDPLSSIAAQLDCDLNGNAYGPLDIIVVYNGLNNNSIECRGPAWPVCILGPGPDWDWNDSTTGEEILGTRNNYEWLADVNNGVVNWSGCLGTVNIRFVTVDPSLEQDVTAWQAYNAPTAVTLEKFTAGQHNDAFSVPIAILFLLTVITVTSRVLAFRRSIQNS